MTAEEVFTEFLYGSGAWLSLIILLTIMFAVSMKYKESGYFFIPISVFIGLSYLDNVAVNSNVLWASFLMFTFAVFQLLNLVKKR